VDTAREASKIIFIGQFPPPISGLTFITSRLASLLVQAGYDVAVYNTTGPAGNRSIFFHATRFVKIGRALFSIASNSLSGKSRVCYLTAEGGLGLIYSVIIAIWARLFRLRIYIHHHSFSYIVRKRLLMKLLTVWSGPEAVHIFLSSGMAEKFASRYGRAIRSLVLSNAALVDSVPSESRDPKREAITIGLLSNLTADKGLHEFTKIVRIGKERGLPIRGVLAGPVVSGTDRNDLESMKKELGKYLDYRGPVYDEEKARFFRDIDVFIFFTTYLNEAQPTVLFEAMAHGIPVISYDRGCIRSQVADGGHVFPQAENIISETLNVLEHYREKPDVLRDQGYAALIHFKEEQRSGQECIANLFEAKPAEVVAFSHER
jgi:glycosyltransferase involved in cell wall biosynthesis